jgi:ketosteroid isomerase-like protein
MSEENVAQLRAIYDDWAKGKLGAGDEIYSPDITFIPIAEGRGVLDREGFRRFMHTFLAQWDDFKVEALQIEDHGDKVLVTERQRATGKGSGIEIDQLFYVAWTFHDDLAISVRWDTDLAEARTEAGIEG